MIATKRTGLRLATGLGLVAMAAAVAYGAVLGNGFVFDDHWTIEDNRFLATPLHGLLRAALRGQARALGIPDATRPAMIASTWFDRHAFGLAPFGYHAHSLLLYAVVSALAAWAALALTSRPRVALVAGLFFAVAPIHAEVVAAINYREDLLAAVGVLVPVAVLFTHRLAPSAPETRAIAGSAAVAAAWAFGLFAKESAVCLVGIALGAALVLRVDASWLRARARTAWALAAVLLVWGNWRIALANGGDDIPRAAPLAVGSRLAATARFEVRAVIESLLPLDWSPDHAREEPASLVWIVLLAAIVAAGVVAARRRSTRTIAMGLVVALAAALPSSPLAGPVNARADRYLFLSILGGGICWGAVAELFRARVPLRLRLPVLAAPLLVLAGLAQPAAAAWADDRALWSAAVERSAGSARAWTGLSRALRVGGDLDGADRACARAIERDPAYAPARVTAAFNALARGDVVAARSAILRARDLDPDARGLATAAACAAKPPDEATACIER